MSIAKKIRTIKARSSWIRKMFEEGAKLKQAHGPENVYDFSLGNPNLHPPDQFKEALKHIVETMGGGEHGYMPNVGFPHVRQKVATYLTAEQEVAISEKDIIMTCGAAGAINVILKAILDPGDEVVVPSPYFVEYNFYIDNHNGIIKTIPTKADFSLDLDAIDAAIIKKTKAILINSPNNPTGAVYTESELIKLANIIASKSQDYDHMIYLIADEPYRKIIFDGLKVPSIFQVYRNSIVASSYSKDLSIPGERIGYLAVNPDINEKEDLMDGMAIANRILGFVNAPGLMQRVIAEVQGQSVNIADYQRKRDLLCDGLAKCGYEFTKPRGAFYLFPKSPIPDDVEFVRLLQNEKILAVPGSGFGKPGYFRIAFCVSDETILGAMPGFNNAKLKS